MYSHNVSLSMEVSVSTLVVKLDCLLVPYLSHRHRVDTMEIGALPRRVGVGVDCFRSGPLHVRTGWGLPRNPDRPHCIPNKVAERSLATTLPSHWWTHGGMKQAYRVVETVSERRTGPRDGRHYGPNTETTLQSR
jgi:hypothetical protein